MGAPIKFLKVTLPESDINEVISVSASDGSEYYGVDNLARDTIFSVFMIAEPRER